MKAAETLEAFRKEYGGKRFAITSHRNADIDALSSMYALRSVFPEAVLALPDKVEEPAREFAEELEIRGEKLSSLDPRDFEGLAVVDTSAPSLLPGTEAWRKILIIDHHHRNSSTMEAEYEIRDENAPSTAEMLALLIPGMGGKVAFALACGIVSDTARFKNGRRETFEQLLRMMEISGREYMEILRHGEPEPGMKLKGEVLEALQKMKVTASGNVLIAAVEVRDNESFIASSISEFADIAVAAKWKASERATKISVRARKSVDVQMNEVMAQVGGEFGGAGGGHSKAAGCFAKERPNIVLRRIIEVVKERL